MTAGVINVKEYETLLVPSKSQESIGKSNSVPLKTIASEGESLRLLCQLLDGCFCYFPWEFSGSC